MFRNFSLIVVILFAALSAGMLKAADTPTPGEARLREALRNTMLQLRTAETENATLQAAKTESDDRAKNLSAKVDALVKQIAADKTVSDKKIADLTANTVGQAAQITALTDANAKWKAASEQATAAATTTETERAKFADSCLKLDRQVADLKSKNAALFKLGNEILSRYEKFGLGTALTAKEPFVGITRVKLQNYVQDYEDKLTEQRAKP
jgi:hypothetical protein